MKYLLDTNICIGMIRQKPLKLLERLVQLVPGEVGVSTITVSELAYGAQKSDLPEKNLTALEKLLLPLEIVVYDYNASIAYGKVRAHLEKLGQPIGPMDMLIGSHALSLDVVLVTNNMREFERIPGLKLEDWMK